MGRARPHGHPPSGRAGVRLRIGSRADRDRRGGLAPRVSRDAPDRASAPGREGAAMSISDPVLAGIGLGFLFGVGLFLLVGTRSEGHTSELQSRFDLVCRLLFEKKNSLSYNHQ